MNSQKSGQAANVTTATDEIKRFGRYLEFNTRDLRESVATLLVGSNTPSPANTFRREAEEGSDEGLFDDEVDIPAGDWVEITDYATEVKEVCFFHVSASKFLRICSLTNLRNPGRQQANLPPSRDPTPRPRRANRSRRPARRHSSSRPCRHPSGTRSAPRGRGRRLADEHIAVRRRRARRPEALPDAEEAERELR